MPRIRAIPVILWILVLRQVVSAQVPLPSWSNTGPRKAILEYITAVTTPGSKDYIPAADRVATFDFDGTLAVEKPLSLQEYFTTWGIKKSFSDSDSGGSREEFRKSVLEWVAAWKHPRFGTGVAGLVYKPMLELMNYLKENGFEVYIVTGTNEDIIRPFAREVFGLPESHVIGTESVLKYKVIDGHSYVVKKSKVDVMTVGDKKPVMIEKHIGKRPAFAAGNGGSDPQMLTYVSDSKYRSLCLLIHHDDPVREYDYFNEPLLKLAKQKGFVIVRMKEDWSTIFP